MRESTRLVESVEDAIDMMNAGFDICPDSIAYQRIENELYWLLSGNSDPLDDALDQLISRKVSISVALDLHDLVADPNELTDQEKTKLHFAVNLKVSKI